MAAKNKSKGLSRRIVRGPPDVREIFAVHLEASQLRDELLEQARELHAAGKIREARKAFRDAERIHERITALEAEVRGSAPEKGERGAH